MLVLTVDQPWATLIVRGIKEWETRGCPLAGPMRPEGVRPLPGFRVDRGERIAIHAAARRVGMVIGQIGDFHIRRGHHDMDDQIIHAMQPDGAWSNLPRGAIVGTVAVTDVVSICEDGCISTPPHIFIDDFDGNLKLEYARRPALGESDRESIEDQRPYGDWSPERFAYRLVDPVMFDTPIPCKGAQGVWRLPDDIAAQVEAAT